VKSNNWKDIAELIGIAAIVASLIFVGLQMRQSQSIAMSDGNLANAANRIERNTSILENPEIWVRGNQGPDLDEKDTVVFRYLVQNVIDTAFFEIVRLRRMGEDDIADSIVADFSAFLFKNPGARRIWSEDEMAIRKYRALLTDSENVGHLELAELVIENLAKLDQMEQ
jgi:hypothetical protein